MPSRNTIPVTIRTEGNSVYYTTAENYLEHSYGNTVNSAVYANSTEDYINKTTEDYINKTVEKFLNARLEEEIEKCIKKIYSKKKIDNE